MKRSRTPKLCKWKRKNRADQSYVELNGKRHYCGLWGSPESQQEYARLLSEWTNGTLEESSSNPSQSPTEAPSKDHMEINELCTRFWIHAKNYYRRTDGSNTNELENFRYAIRPLRALYGHTPVSEFGPLSLEAVREHIINSDKKSNTQVSKQLSRFYVNRLIKKIKYVFKWGVSKELVPPSIYHGLSTIESLKKGREKRVYETKKVKPAPEHLIKLIQPHVSEIIWDMIQLQLHTAMRPEEVRLFTNTIHTFSGSQNVSSSLPESVGRTCKVIDLSPLISVFTQSEISTNV